MSNQDWDPQWESQALSFLKEVMEGGADSGERIEELHSQSEWVGRSLSLTDRVKCLEKVSLLAQEAGDLELSLWSQQRSRLFLDILLQSREHPDNGRAQGQKEWESTQGFLISRLRHLLWKRNSSRIDEIVLAQS